MAKRVEKDRPAYWAEVHDDRRRRWPIYLSREDISPDDLLDKSGEALMGVTNIDRRRILVNANFPRSRWEVTVLHEIFHVVFVDTAISYNESTIDVAAVRGLPILHSLGFRLPPPPRLPWRLKRRKP